MNLSPYRKAIVAILGVLVLVGNRLYGADLGLGDSVQDIADMIIMVALPTAVFAVPNAKA